MRGDFQRVSETSLEQPPVERAELDRLQNVVRADVLFSGEIRQRAGNLEDAIMGAGGEIHLFHGVL